LKSQIFVIIKKAFASMTPPFLCLLAAAAIFRYLSSDAHKAFRARLVSLLPRNVMRDHLRVLQLEFPDRLGKFRRSVLPFSALHVLLNAAACLCFIAAVWFFPPIKMQKWDLLFVRYGSVAITPVALAVDLIAFGKLLASSFGHPGEANGAA
jgi:hypothetical protein